jgi:hypothetical protein
VLGQVENFLVALDRKLDAAEPLADFIATFERTVRDDFNLALSNERARWLMLKLTTLYGEAESCARDMHALKFSRHEIEYARAVLSHRSRFAQLPQSVEALDTHRFFRDTRAAAIGLIVFAVSQSTDAIDTANALLQHYVTNYAHIIAPKPLVNGAEMSERFGLQGPHIGQCLRVLLEAQVSGTVQNIADAEKFIADFRLRIAD